MHEASRHDVARRRKALGFLVAAFVAVCLYNDIHNGIWLDEAYSLNTSQRDLGGVLAQTLHFELQPPIYFILLHWWLALCPSMVCARLLSTAFAAGVLCFLGALMPLLGVSSRGMSLSLLGALSPMLLWAGSTARGYALTALIAAASLVFYLRIWGEGRTPDRRDWILHLVAWCFGVFNFYFFAFVIAGQVLGALFSGKARRGLALSVAAFASVLLAAAPVIAGQVHSHETTPPPIVAFPAMDDHASSRFVKLVGQLAGPVLNYSPVLEHPAGALLLAAGGITLLAFRIASRRPWNSSGPEGLLLPTVVVPLLALWAMKSFGFSVLTRRHAIIVLPGMLCMLVLWVNTLSLRAVRRTFQLALLGLFLVSAVAFQIDYRPPGDWKAAARIVLRESSASEPILIFPSDNALAYHYGTKTTNPIRGVPRDPDLTRWSLSGQVVRDERDVAGVMSRDTATGRAVWLLLEQGETAERLGLARVNEYVRDQTEILQSWALPGSPDLQLLHVRPIAPAGRTGQ